MFVDLPLAGFAAQELKGSGGVVNGGRQRMGGGESVFDRRHGDALVEVWLYIGGDLFFAAATPTAAVDVDDHWPRAVAFGQPIIEHVPGVGAVGDVGVGRGRRVGSTSGSAGCGECDGCDQQVG